MIKEQHDRIELPPVPPADPTSGRRWPVQPLAQRHRAPGPRTAAVRVAAILCAREKVLAGCNRTHPLVSRSYEAKGGAA